MNAPTKSLTVSVSGNKLSILEVLLFPEVEVQKVFALRNEAQEDLAGFSTGIGFWGSPGWVLGGVALLSAYESIVSNSRTKKGIAKLKEASKSFELLREKGIYFGVSKIDNINKPNPAEWNAIGETTELSLEWGNMGGLQKRWLIEVEKVSLSEESGGTALVTRRAPYIHNGEEFLWVKSEDGPCALRWEAVETYQLIEKPP